MWPTADKNVSTPILYFLENKMQFFLISVLYIFMFHNDKVSYSKFLAH